MLSLYKATRLIESLENLIYSTKFCDIVRLRNGMNTENIIVILQWAFILMCIEYYIFCALFSGEENSNLLLFYSLITLR